MALKNLDNEQNLSARDMGVSATPFLVNLVLIILVFLPNDTLVPVWSLPYLGFILFISTIFTIGYFFYRHPDIF